eukprot:evm.model.scf_271.3 EVM.evm.TU.scf_271.3   scf_271:42136-47602(+)
MLCPEARCACAVALLLLLQPRGAVGDALDDLIGSVEGVVNQVADRATEAYRTRFTSVAACACSRHACDGDFAAGGTCHQELGDSELCGGCSGQKLDFENSFVLTPPTTDPSTLDSGLKDSICTFRVMDEVFSEARDEFGIRAWTYIATGDGVMRTWPGHAMERGDDVPPGEGNAELGNCKPYEPHICTFAEWSVEAAAIELVCRHK